MSTYIVKVKAEIPYPWEKEYRIAASGASTAVARAIRAYRKEERIQRKRITSYRIAVDKLN
jgi:hypothetical protein